MSKIFKELSITLKMYFIILIFLLLLIISGCSSEPKTQETETVVAQVSVYDSWNKAEYENIRIIYPPGHPFTDKMKDYAKIYKTVLRRNAQFFRMAEPTDTIVMLYYTGFGQGQEMAVSEFPTVRNDTIFYWSGNKFGITAAMYILNKWSNKMPLVHDLWYNGIMRLLDASGRDYHAMTLAFIDSQKFIPINELVVDDRVDYKWEAYQSTEAASLIDYLVFTFGIDKFKLIYEAKIPFDSSVQKICKMDLIALQKDWLQVITKASKKSN